MPTPQDAFDIASATLLADAGTTTGRAFHAQALKVRGKIFAMLVEDELVLKLSSDRCGALVEEGAARPFEMGRRRMREWVRVAEPDLARWSALAEEARAYVRGQADGS